MSWDERARMGSVEFWASYAPERLALCEAARSFTYAQWNASADRVAELLAQRGKVGAGDRVAVCMHNRIEWFVAQAAIAKLDALLVPISYRLTPSEVHYIVADCEARAFLFDAEDADAMARVWTNEPATEAHAPACVNAVLSVARSKRDDVTTFAEIIEGPAVAPRFAARIPRSIVYTSGTTGRPRGVLQREEAPKERPQRSPERGSEQKPRSVRSADGTPQARNLLGAPLSHAAGQASARSCHVVGGCVYLMPRFDAEEALRTIAREKITMSFLVPTMLSRIVGLPAEVRARYDVSSIKLLTTGASPCPHDVKEKVIAYFGDHCLVESYGSTEVGIVARMMPGDHLKKPGSCGQLLQGVELRLVDEHGRDVPRGALGEVLVKTPHMIERYLNEGTPADLRDGFFATGDVARLDEDGFLFIVDRKKDMIIAGGVNIYPAEIEQAFRKHPAVIDVAAFGVPHHELGEEVKAAVELAPGHSASERELIDFVSQELAVYKRPRSIDFMRELPRNPAGKLLKNELRAPYWQGHEKKI